MDLITPIIQLLNNFFELGQKIWQILTQPINQVIDINNVPALIKPIVNGFLGLIGQYSMLGVVGTLGLVLIISHMAITLVRGGN